MAKKKKHYSRMNQADEYPGMMNRNDAVDPRIRFQMEDEKILHEDHSAIANLPQDVKYHAWPKDNYYRRYDLDDTIEGVDHQMKEDSRLGKRNKNPEMY